jgi:hypothetical protein
MPSTEGPAPADHRPDEGDTGGDAPSQWARVGRQWDEAGAALAGLAEELRRRYHGGGEPTDPRLREALDRAGEAFAEAMGAIGRSIDDPQVRDRAARSASAFGSAVAATLDALGEQLQRSMGQGTSEEGPAGGDGPPA